MITALRKHAGRPASACVAPKISAYEAVGDLGSRASPDPDLTDTGRFLTVRSNLAGRIEDQHTDDDR